MSAVCFAREGHDGSADEIREYMSGNLCRCGTTLVDLMKLEVLTPSRVLDINRLPLRAHYPLQTPDRLLNGLPD